MQISTGAVTALGPSYADLQKVRDAAKAAAAERKQAVQQGAAKALASPRFSAPDSAKEQARVKLQQIRERMNILKKLFGANPKELARALKEVFKELKAAVKEYSDADKQEMGLSGDTVSGALTTPAPSDDASGDEGSDAKTDAASGDPTAADAPAADKTSTDAEPIPDPAAKSGASLYDDTVRAVRDTIGADGLEFIKEVRALTQKIHEVLEAARGQARIHKQDKDTDEAFKQADEALGSLDKAMSDMETDIHQAAPTAGMQLSVAA
jgi:hypothetical protein